jgi:hypothetical protein
MLDTYFSTSLHFCLPEYLPVSIYRYLGITQDSGFVDGNQSALALTLSSKINQYLQSTPQFDVINCKEMLNKSI